jgi:hypothetical protein
MIASETSKPTVSKNYAEYSVCSGQLFMHISPRPTDAQVRNLLRSEAEKSAIPMKDVELSCIASADASSGRGRGVDGALNGPRKVGFTKRLLDHHCAWPARQDARSITTDEQVRNESGAEYFLDR